MCEAKCHAQVDTNEEVSSDEWAKFKHSLSVLETMLDVLHTRICNVDAQLCELTGKFIERSDECNARIRSLEHRPKQ